MSGTPDLSDDDMETPMPDRQHQIARCGTVSDGNKRMELAALVMWQLVTSDHEVAKRIEQEIERLLRQVDGV
jgi:hypothetical protein